MISAIILAAFLVLRALIQYAFNMPSQKGFKKGKIFLIIILSLASVINSMDSHSSYLPIMSICGTLYYYLRHSNARFQWSSDRSVWFCTCFLFSGRGSRRSDFSNSSRTRRREKCISREWMICFLLWDGFASAAGGDSTSTLAGMVLRLQLCWFCFCSWICFVTAAEVGYASNLG
jgi:hypothetical protein